jgi:hypothetical protein
MSGKKSSLKNGPNVGPKKSITIEDGSSILGFAHDTHDSKGRPTRKFTARSYKLPNARKNARRDIMLMKELGGLDDNTFAVIEARDRERQEKKEQYWNDQMTPKTGGRRKRKTRRRRH